MPSITGPGADLTELAERICSLAEALKRLPADHPLPFKEKEALSEEVRAIAAQLRAKDCPSR